ncbi:MULTISPECIES: hypothetical protein [Parachlamydia]|jgi:hypothetical protein|uniref:Uncharacterized protein n=2 Tax=Parachlamydia acanthamoebae TaxID=83552 RepID=F8L0W4_PARAV|nr:hypothetical protein [Parachlamydia acanthamoebae]EFB42655.1 hypothetical protein pah_c004o191 [Parachlamydia acanthamoebae str. Hall's coccus]KIA77455.1 hypothetical protein DB43_GG00340 [Parachlamydia acanthamoebae]CCB86872.1 putative uncharacterized protein [Parachlamydia acanthamoebae UV-7]
MSTEIEKRILVKVFVGCRLHAELRLQLNQSHAWKQVKIESKPQDGTLCEVHYQQKDYVGMFLPQETLTLSELKEYERLVQQKFKEYCPSLEEETIKLVVFPQIFIS